MAGTGNASMGIGVQARPGTEEWERENRWKTLQEHAVETYGNANPSTAEELGIEYDLRMEGLGGTECCCRKDLVQNFGGPEYTHYVCTEAAAGKCRWRMTQEPTVLCRFMASSRVMRNGHSVEIRSCTREEAQAEAEILFAEQRALSGV